LIINLTGGIAAYLLGVEVDSTGLAPNQKSAEYVVRMLKEYREMIDAEYP
jgi:hypothetical protein